MGTTAEKLQAILAAKEDIGAAITEKGGAVPEKLKEYGAAIRALPTSGGGGELVDEPLDPWRVYRATRPAEWLPMPEPGPMEVWFLVHIPPVVAGDDTSGKTTVGVTYSGPYTVETGTLVDGAFVAQTTTQVESGDYTVELANGDFATKLADNKTAQALMRFKLGEPGAKKNFSLLKATGNDGVVEIWGDGADNNGIAKMLVRSNSGSLFAPNLTYFNVKNQSDLKFDTYFSGLSHLVAVLDWGAPAEVAGSINGTFMNCNSLLAFPKQPRFVMSGSTTIRSAITFIAGCTSIFAVDFSRFANIGRASRMIQEAKALRVIKNFDLSGATLIEGLCEDCYGLQCFENFNPYGASSLKDVFKGCVSLRRLTFAPLEGSWTRASDLDLSYTNMDREGIVEMLQSIPANGSGAEKTITLIGTPGADKLTAEDIKLAADKNWTLVLKEESA